MAADPLRGVAPPPIRQAGSPYPPLRAVPPVPLEYAVDTTQRWAARRRDGGWFAVRQVRKGDGRWYSQLHTQMEASGRADAIASAAGFAAEEREG